MYFGVFEYIKYIVNLIEFYHKMVCFSNLSIEFQLVFNLYLNWMKKSNLFYLFLVDFEVCGPKEDFRMIIRQNFKKPIV